MGINEIKEYIKWKDDLSEEFRIFFFTALKAYVGMVKRDTGRDISIILYDCNDNKIVMPGYEIRHLNPTEEEKQYLLMEQETSKYKM